MYHAEPVIKKKRENLMDHKIGDAPHSSLSPRVRHKDIPSSPDPFSDCSPTEGSPSGDYQRLNEIEKMEIETGKTTPNTEIAAAVKQTLTSLSQLPVVKPTFSETPVWRGSPLEDIQKSRYGFSQMPPIKPSSTHTVMFQVVSGKREPGPRSPDAWDNEHVRLPCSTKSFYPVRDKLQPRWDMIRMALGNQILNSYDLEKAIMTYNAKYKGRWDFAALHQFFNEEIEPPEKELFFSVLMPQMVALALKLPELITRPIPLLRQHQTHAISFSQMQVACLLANAFFCTFPRRNSSKQASEYASFPDINFNRLFQLHRRKSSMQRSHEKLKCIFHYFRRICQEPPSGAITFMRRYMPAGVLPLWDRSGHYFRKLHVTSSGTIEDQGKGMLQTDFANKMIGGGVLGWGCVQEEIRFVICPELILARLFTECLDASEALLVSGCEQFSKYQGYADNFTWDGDYQDVTPRDSSGRLMCSVTAIDAMAFRFPSNQFTAQNMMRELNKAYAGFFNSEIPTEHLIPIATGNWGCGVYRGNKHLKALLQLMAAAQVGRPLVYFSFGDAQLCVDIAELHKFLVEKHATTGSVWRALSEYYNQCYRSGSFTVNLYNYIYHAIDPSHIIRNVSTRGRNRATSGIPNVKSFYTKISLHKSEGISPTKPAQKTIKRSLTASPKKQKSPDRTGSGKSPEKVHSAVGRPSPKKSVNTPTTSRNIFERMLVNSAKQSAGKKVTKARKKKNVFAKVPKHAQKIKEDAETESGIADLEHAASPFSWLQSSEDDDEIKDTIQKRINDYFYEINVPK